MSVVPNIKPIEPEIGLFRTIPTMLTDSYIIEQLNEFTVYINNMNIYGNPTS